MLGEFRFRRLFAGISGQISEPRLCVWFRREMRTYISIRSITAEIEQLSSGDEVI